MEDNNDKSTIDAADNIPPELADHTQSSFSDFLRSPSVKFVVISVLTMLLMVPTLFVWGLVEERADRAREVSRRIEAGWGGEQTLNGPYLAVPVNTEETVFDEQTKTNRIVPKTNWVLVMPEKLDIESVLDSDVRKLSIYSLPVYNAKLKLKGKFAADTVEQLKQYTGTPDLSQATLIVNIGDIRGIRSDVNIRIDGGAPQPFEPGMRGFKAQVYDTTYASYYRTDSYSSRESDTGINVNLTQIQVEKGFAFEIDMALNGSSGINIAPAGRTTSLTAQSNWASPNFEGAYLPEQHAVTEKGFTANWTIPFLARGVDKSILGNYLPLGNSLMSIKLTEPVKFYLMVVRTLKYSVGFLSLTFFAFFIIELTSKRYIHWVQYILAGLGLVIFYVMLLAIAEHIGFGPAYGIAALAVTLLLSLYMGSLLGRAKGGILLVVLGLSYAVMYLILQEDEYALLAGSIIAFVTIAATMYFTRSVDWSGKKKEQAKI